MKLAVKLVFIFMVVIVVLIIADAVFGMRAATKRFKSDLAASVERVRGVLIELEPGPAHHTWLEWVQRANRVNQRVQFRLVRTDGSAGNDQLTSAAVTADEVRRSAQGVLHEESQDGEDMLAYVLVRDGGDDPPALEGWMGMAELHAQRLELITRGCREAAAMLLLGGISSVLLGSRLVAKPLQRLMDKTRRIGEGDLSGPLELGGRDELSELADSINMMCEQLAESQEQLQQETAKKIEAIEQLRHADRLRTVGRLASGIAHELGTPLNVISGRTGMLAGGELQEPQVVENARIIKVQSDRMAKTIRHVLDFARQKSPAKARADVHALVKATVNLLTSLAQKNNVSLIVDPPKQSVFAEIDTEQIRQVFTNLIVNGVQAMPEGGQLCVSVGPVTARCPEDPEAHPRPCVRVDFEDHGTGIVDEDLDRLFDPFFTTKEVGEGTGLGLSIAYGIVREHGGWIEVASAVGKGSTFSVFLPSEAQPCQAES